MTASFTGTTFPLTFASSGINAAPETTTWLRGDLAENQSGLRLPAKHPTDLAAPLTPSPCSRVCAD